MAANAAFFSNASNSNFDGLQFNVVQNIHSLAVDPLDILHRHRALEASHTSKTAASAPKCKPGTRTKAIADLTIWAKELPSSSRKSVLWLRGPAGAGKTCIMRVVARICRQDGVLAGDYFFSTRVPGLDDEAPFVATIVSQLVVAIPALDHPVREIIRSDPTIFEQSLELQVEKLISNHAASILSQTSAPRIIVVDGFDECRDQKQREHLLRLLYSLVTPPHSFRVVMASRPEYDIRTAFNQAPLKSITKILRLEEYEVSGEIYQYLSDEFARIRDNHPAKQYIPLDWPGEAMLHALTDKSSGIWAYPSTVIKYVDNPRRRPVELLGDILDASSTASSGRPFAELDALYKIIFNPPDIDIPLMKRLLHLTIEITRSGSGVGFYGEILVQKILSAPRLDEFLSFASGTTEMTLCDLHSVLSVAEDTDRPWIYFHHKSLEDYLCSPERAGDLYQSQADTHFDILTVCTHNLELWNRKLVSPAADFQNVDTIPDYLCVALRHLLFERKCFPPSLLDFDARIVWRCFAFAGRYPPDQDDFKDFVNSFHNAMCKEGAECRRSCASFRRMLEYLGKLWDVVYNHLAARPIERLMAFEEECQGLFAPLDWSPATVVDTTAPVLDNASAHLRPPNNLLASVSGDDGTGGHFIPESTSTTKKSRRFQDDSELDLSRLGTHLTTGSHPSDFDDPAGTSKPQTFHPAGHDDASAPSPPPDISSESESGDVGVAVTPESTSTVPGHRSKALQTHSANPPTFETPIGTVTSNSQVPTTAVSDDTSVGIPPRKVSFESESAGEAGVYLTPEPPLTANGSVRLALPMFLMPLAVKLVWLALPIIVIILGFYFLKPEPTRAP